MRKILFVLGISLSILIFANDMVKFVPKDFDGVLLMEDASRSYFQVKKVPIAEFILSDSGLNLENIVEDIVNNEESSCGVDGKEFYVDIGRGFLLATRGVKIDLEGMVSLDVNYYLDVLKTLGSNSILVFQSKAPKNFIRTISCLIDYNINFDGNFYTLSGENYSIYAKVFEGYVLMSGGKTTINKAIASFKNESESLYGTDEEFKSFINGSAIVLGYFKSDTFVLKAPFELNGNGIKTRLVKMVGFVDENRFVLEIRQFFEGQSSSFEGLYLSEDGMDDLPLLGEFFMELSLENIRTVITNLMEWYSGEEEELEKLKMIFTNIIKNSTGEIGLVGGLTDATEVSIATLFNFDFLKWDELEEILYKYGGKKEGKHWYLKMKSSVKLFVYKFKDKLVISTVSYNDFKKIYESKRLKDVPVYNYLSNDFNSKSLVRSFVNIGAVIEKILGVKIRSGMIFQQYMSEDGKCLIYELEVM